MDLIYIRPPSETTKRKVSDEPIMIVRHHWFGLFALISPALGVLILVGLIIAFVPSGEETLASRVSAFSILVLAGLVGAILFGIIWQIYFNSRLILTADTVSQKVQVAIFERKESQLGLANIEDVTSSRSGFFQTIMNFGTLTIETAGEQNNFHFRYCPSPDRCVKVIMDARSAFLTDNSDVVSKLR